jgi:hypothetical protein
MLQQRPKPTADAPRVEYLLGVLRGLSQQGPPPALRHRLELVAFERLRGGSKLGRRALSPQDGLRSWLRPAFVVALLVAIGTVAALVAYVHQSESLRAGIELRVAQPGVTQPGVTQPGVTQPGVAQPKETFGGGTLAAVPAAVIKPPKIHHGSPRLAQNTTARRMVVRLPYSNSAIDTGTDATLRVSMSQAELVSLGFPMNGTLHEGRVVADLTLGDDGLPRAISVTLPLELVREKK